MTGSTSCATSSTSTPRSTKPSSWTWRRSWRTTSNAPRHRSRPSWSGTPPACRKPTPRGWSGWPPRLSRWPRSGTAPRTQRTLMRSASTFPTTARSTTATTSSTTDVRAVVASGPGGPDVLSVAQLPDIEPGAGEVAIRVAATAVNRADVLQRQGHYPPPPGASDVLGLECSGTIAAIGDGVTGRTVGEPCCALLAGGGYADLVVVPAGQVMPVPAG